jgi:hypothetical protein
MYDIRINKNCKYLTQTDHTTDIKNLKDGLPELYFRKYTYVYLCVFVPDVWASKKKNK